MKQLFTLSLLLMLALSGCTREEVGREDVFDGQAVSFSLVNQDLEAIKRVTTPGEEPLNENLVVHLDVFFFDHAGQCLYYPTASQMKTDGAKVTINVPKNIVNMLFGEDIKLYVIANCTLLRENLEGKSYNELIETVCGVSQDFNPLVFVPQKYFLMDGTLSVNDLTEERTDLGEVILSRAASKINILITGAAINGFTPVEAHVRLDNYLESTALGQDAPLYTAKEEDYKHSGYRPITLPGMTQYPANPFYSYSNNWEYGDSKESYITIRVKWYKNDGGAEPKEYYYRLPFNNILPADDRFCLKRNYTYTFKVNIGVLGGLDPDQMVDLKPDFEIKDWTTNRIVARLNQYDYLVVSETNVEMHDIAKRSIKYSSSQPVSVDIKNVYHFTYLASGTIREDKIEPTDPRYPVIEANEGNSEIDITSPVPGNYVPVMISFRVSNTKGLYQDVYVIQYPRQYITSKFSNWDDIDFKWYKDQGRTSFWSNDGKGGDGMQNFNLYTVTTTSLDSSDGFSIGGDMMHNEYNLTDDKILSVTKKDAASNNMISPQFVIASQRGITSIKTSYGTAQVRCAYYMEGTYDRGTWRIPTVAEMLLISKLQRDGNSAINELFTPGSSGEEGSDRWWTARQDVINGVDHYYSVKVTTGELVVEPFTIGKINYASVRCVRDVWKN